jgi:cyanophycin synthetase
MSRGPGSLGLGTRLLSGVARAGPRGRVLGTRLDLLRELGVRAARRQRAAARAATAWAVDARRAIYTEIWQEAADEVGALLRAIDRDFLELTREDRRTVVHFHHVQLDDAVSLELALDKPLVNRLLRDAGLPLPDGIELATGDVDAARAFLATREGAWVVKPARGTSGGTGVTCGIESADDFARARLRAARFDDRMLVERMARGDEYRLLFLEGALLDVLRRRPPRVVADGRSSVATLVEEENRRRAASRGRAGMSFLQVDLDCVLALRHAGWSLRSVPPAGTEVVLKATANENGSADNETVGPEHLCTALVADARAAVDAVGLRFGAVELVTPDPVQPLEAAGGVVLEVNGTPGLHYHYLVADPDGATRVAVPLLRRLLEGPTDEDVRLRSR